MLLDTHPTQSPNMYKRASDRYGGEPVSRKNGGFGGELERYTPNNMQIGASAENMR